MPPPANRPYRSTRPNLLPPLPPRPADVPPPLNGIGAGSVSAAYVLADELLDVVTAAMRRDSVLAPADAMAAQCYVLGLTIAAMEVEASAGARIARGAYRGIAAAIRYCRRQMAAEDAW